MLMICFSSVCSSLSLSLSLSLFHSRPLQLAATLDWLAPAEAQWHNLQRSNIQPKGKGQQTRQQERNSSNKQAQFWQENTFRPTLWPRQRPAHRKRSMRHEFCFVVVVDIRFVLCRFALLCFRLERENCDHFACNFRTIHSLSGPSFSPPSFSPLLLLLFLSVLLLPTRARRPLLLLDLPTFARQTRLMTSCFPSSLLSSF